VGPIPRRTGHPSGCRPRHTNRVVRRRSENPPLIARIARAIADAVMARYLFQDHRFLDSFLVSFGAALAGLVAHDWRSIAMMRCSSSRISFAISDKLGDRRRCQSDAEVC